MQLKFVGSGESYTVFRARTREQLGKIFYHNQKWMWEQEIDISSEELIQIYVELEYLRRPIHGIIPEQE